MLKELLCLAGLGMMGLTVCFMCIIAYSLCYPYSGYPKTEEV